MIMPVLEQGGLFLGTILAGYVLAFFYDIFRVFRRIVLHKAIFIHLEDIIFWLLVIAAVFYFLLSRNSGEIRFFSICGVFVGMFVYVKTTSKIFLKFSMAIYNFIKKVVLLLLSIILTPIKMLLHLLSFPANFVLKRLKTVYRYEKRVYNGVKIRGKQGAKKFRNDLSIILRKT